MTSSEALLRELVLSVYPLAEPIEWQEDTRTVCHLLWMLETCERFTDDGKRNRWLGWVAAMLVERHGFTDAEVRDVFREAAVVPQPLPVRKIDKVL